MATTDQKRFSENGKSNLALAAAVGSLLLSGGVLLKQRDAKPACICEERTSAPDEILGSLDKRIALLELAAVRIAAATSKTEDPTTKGHTQHAEAPIEVPVAKTRAPLKFDTSNQAFTVRETSPGNYAVTNTDPSLTGKRLIVEGRGADGTIETISIVVPPPAEK